MSSSILRKFLPGLLASVFAATMTCAPADAQQQQRPNIVIIWGDDVGQSNVSAYSRGVMGYTTPNIDRLASEGVMFTDYYAEQSCGSGMPVHGSAFDQGPQITEKRAAVSDRPLDNFDTRSLVSKAISRQSRLPSASSLGPSLALGF